MDLEERWVEIEDFPNYSISNNGRVMNNKTRRLLSFWFINSGYLCVGLWNETGQHHKTVHRLVANAFVYKENEDFEVNHLDGDKSNNYDWNLEWVSRSQNRQHAYDTGLQNPPNRQKVRIIETGEIFESQLACAKAIGGRQSTIQRLINGIGKSHMGYRFERVD